MKKVFAAYLVFLLVLMSSLIIAGCAGNGGSSDQTDGQNTSTDTDTDTDTVLPDPTVNIFINQVLAQCLDTDNALISAYVTVIDEAGDPIDGLQLSDFQITENGNAVFNADATLSTVQEPVTTPVSFSIIMDYSNSMQLDTAAQTAMEQAVLNFIELMRTNDQAEIIKFNNGIRLNTAFTSDKQTLRDAVATPVETGATYIYDTLYTGVSHLATQTGHKAVIAITDGRESHDTLYTGDDRTRTDVINLANANNAPLFLIGLGNDIHQEDLLIMAEETGGHLYLAASSDELNDIYAHISDLLIESQYLLEFEAPTIGASTGNLSISVTYDGATDSADTTFTYAACP